MPYEPLLRGAWWEQSGFALEDIASDARYRVRYHADTRRIGPSLLNFDLCYSRILLRDYWDSVEIEDASDGGDVFSPDFNGLTADFINCLMELVAVHAHMSEYPRDVPDADEAFHHCGSCDTYQTDWCDNCEECTNCHTCVVCSGCDERVDRDDWCSECEQCEHCCECRHCDECDRDRSCSFCNECDHCENCCRCSEGARLMSRTERREPWRATSLEHRSKFPSSRLCGVEWEFNLVKNARPISRWCAAWGGGIHSDSSAGRTDGDSGWEAVTPPIAGDHIRKCLTALGEAFDEADAKTNDHCGIHVHVDASDLYWSDMYRLLRVYAHVEPILFVLAGQNRHTNQYCYKVGPIFEDALKRLDRKGSILALTNLEMSTSRPYYDEESARRRFREKSVHKKEVGRYRSLNIVPWLARYRSRSKHNPKAAMNVDATVEFRLHKHSLDWERVTQWAELCVTIVDWVNKASDAEAEALLKMTSLRALATIAPRSAAWILQRVRDWKRATRRNGGTRRTIRFVEGVWTCAA